MLYSQGTNAPHVCSFCVRVVIGVVVVVVVVAMAVAVITDSGLSISYSKPIHMLLTNIVTSRQ